MLDREGVGTQERDVGADGFQVPQRPLVHGGKGLRPDPPAKHRNGPGTREKRQRDGQGVGDRKDAGMGREDLGEGPRGAPGVEEDSPGLGDELLSDGRDPCLLLRVCRPGDEVRLVGE